MPTTRQRILGSLARPSTNGNARQLPIKVTLSSMVQLSNFDTAKRALLDKDEFSLKNHGWMNSKPQWKADQANEKPPDPNGSAIFVFRSGFRLRERMPATRASAITPTSADAISVFPESSDLAATQRPNTA